MLVRVSNGILALMGRFLSLSYRPKASSALGMISRTISYLGLSRDVRLSLYKSLIQPHLEFAVSAWSPYITRTNYSFSVCNIVSPKCFQLSDNPSAHSIKCMFAGRHA